MNNVAWRFLWPIGLFDCWNCTLLRCGGTWPRDSRFLEWNSHMEKIKAPPIMSALVLCIRTCLSSFESDNRCFRFSLNSLTFSWWPQGLSASPPTTTSTDWAKSPISILGIGALADMELRHTQFQKAISNLKTRSATRKIRRHFNPGRYILGCPPRRCTLHHSSGR
jgi:hypothetical protein